MSKFNLIIIKRAYIYIYIYIYITGYIVHLDYLMVTARFTVNTTWLNSAIWYLDQSRMERNREQSMTDSDWFIPHHVTVNTTVQMTAANISDLYQSRFEELRNDSEVGPWIREFCLVIYDIGGYNSVRKWKMYSKKERKKNMPRISKIRYYEKFMTKLIKMVYRDEGITTNCINYIGCFKNCISV
jgi:hypothetical protein